MTLREMQDLQKYLNCGCRMPTVCPRCSILMSKRIAYENLYSRPKEVTS